jgi:hypothetical protein
LADRLFPGTSTIQTRIRYFLIVPWCHQHIEDKRVGHPRFAQQVDKLERDLIAPLLDQDDVAGVFGRITGHGVKRLPSAVYWSSLGAWKVRTLDLTQSNYYRRIDQFYDRRKAVRRKDDGEAIRDPYSTMRHPDMPRRLLGFRNNWTWISPVQKQRAQGSDRDLLTSQLHASSQRHGPLSPHPRPRT